MSIWIVFYILTMDLYISCFLGLVFILVMLMGGPSRMRLNYKIELLLSSKTHCLLIWFLMIIVVLFIFL